MTAWWDGLGPVDAQLDAAGLDGHTIRWDAGELVLVDHPDPEAEDALAALGGARCPCLDVLAAWRAQHVDPSVVTIGPHRPGDRVALDVAAVDRLREDAERWRNQWAAVASDLGAQGDAAGLARLREVAAPAERALAARLGFLRLLALEPALVERLVVSVISAAADKWGASPAGALPPRWQAILGARGVASLGDLLTIWREGSGLSRR
jgi:hypothetical protein